MSLRVKFSLEELSAPLLANGLKTLIEDGVVGSLAIIGDGLTNATAVGRLLDIDPSILASSRDTPLVIELASGNAAFATFGGIRFLDNQRILDWISMVQRGDFRGATSDNATPIDILPRLHRSGQGH